MARDFRPVVEAAFQGLFTVESEIARGGISIVFLARDSTSGDQIALKVLRPELSAIVRESMFLREIEIAGSVQHPNILPVLQSGSRDGLLYLTMRYVSGGSLDRKLGGPSRFAIDDALRIGWLIGNALDCAHRQGIVHGDVKPHNVLVDGDQVFLTDFGIAAAAVGASTVKHGGTTAGLVFATPDYASPEQITRDAPIDARSDVYSLGCVVYALLVGEPPFASSSIRTTMSRHLAERIPSIRIARAEVPAGVQQSIERAMAKNPADRYEAAAEFAEDLRYHAERFQATREAKVRGQKAIFIGHGHSAAWKELRDFLEERLGLATSEFDRESPAGVATVDRLQSLVDNAAFALLVLTGEDEHADGSLHARENVIHEVGLFQGRLGFRKAIMLVEEGCATFSNVHGVGEIRFEKDELIAEAEEIRRVLEREGLLDQPRGRWSWFRFRRQDRHG
jgi:serine/threonine protein kinase